jgi:uncharacterized membrane protein YhaH (DUF805 family)
MGNLIDHCKRLLDFRGRETAVSFWPWVACIIAMSFVAMMGVIMPMILSTFGRMQQFAAEHPDQATVSQGPGHYSVQIEGHHPELMPDMGAMMGGMTVLVAIVVLLLAAAVTRRLHDTGKRGWWGLMPVPFLLHGFYGMATIFNAAEPDLSGFFLLFANNMIYLVTLGILAFMLIGKSQQGPNAWGEQPAR